MAIVIRNIKIPLDKEEALLPQAAKKLGLPQSEIEKLTVKRQSLDSRKKNMSYVYTVHASLKNKRTQQRLEERFEKAEEYRPPQIKYGCKKTAAVVVVGTGPCGLFAALTLAEHGYQPLVLERGKNMFERTKDVVTLSKNGILNQESNICFGAGGAGAFSDGKLTTRIKDPRCDHVLKTLVDHGAPKEIAYLAKPHTGTENIRRAVTGIIKDIERLGGSVQFESRLTAVKTDSDGLCSITYENNGIATSVETSSAILAIGHSARDTYEYLSSTGIAMQAKPFAVGLRIEHPREFIDIAQLGEYHTRLGAAEYRLTSRQGSRGVYTFCMCPGGEVVNSSTEEGGIAVNGMSYYARNMPNSNSAVVVSINPKDFGETPLSGVEFQRKLEQSAYDIAGGKGAPCQKLCDFRYNRATKSFGSVTPSFSPSVIPVDINACLPSFVSSGIKYAVEDFDTKLKGFDMDDAVLTGVETRTSAPLRILRDDNLQSVGLPGLFPAGEGAGYAGGIVSAAVDGIKCATALMEQYTKPV